MSEQNEQALGTHREMVSVVVIVMFAPSSFQPFHCLPGPQGQRGRDLQWVATLSDVDQPQGYVPGVGQRKLWHGASVLREGTDVSQEAAPMSSRAQTGTPMARPFPASPAACL